MKLERDEPFSSVDGIVLYGWHGVEGNDVIM